MEDIEWSLLNASSDITTKAVGLVLDETELSFNKLKKAAAKAKDALGTLDDIRKGIKIATATLSLAAVVLSKDFGAVAKNAKAILRRVDRMR